MAHHYLDRLSADRFGGGASSANELSLEAGYCTARDGDETDSCLLRTAAAPSQRKEDIQRTPPTKFTVGADDDDGDETNERSGRVAVEQPPPPAAGNNGAELQRAILRELTSRQTHCGQKAPLVAINVDECSESSLEATQLEAGRPSGTFGDKQLPPAAPPPSRISSALDLSCVQRELLLLHAADANRDAAKPLATSMTSVFQAGATPTPPSEPKSSMSDSGCPTRTRTRRHTAAAGEQDCQDKSPSKFERKQIEQRVRNWKRSNKLITNICENPSTIHLECFDTPSEQATATPSTGQKVFAAAGGEAKKTEKLHYYANHLSSIHADDQKAAGDEFRNLLYDIICCLLVQDEQVLATASVGKILDVIRSHLDSISRVYSNASTLAFATSNAPPSNRKQSSGSTASCTSGSVAAVDERLAALVVGDKVGCSQRAGTMSPRHLVDSTTSAQLDKRREKPADFRRISSVSYNDEQLIHDLCDSARTAGAQPSGGRSSSLSATDSPWTFTELSAERLVGGNSNSAASSSGGQQYTSQSSLEHSAACTMATDLMNDSGNGTMYEFQISPSMSKAKQVQTFGGSAAKNALNLSSRRRSDASQKLPAARVKRQLTSYLSTDDCFSSSCDGGNTQLYDEECSPTLPRRVFSSRSHQDDGQQQSDEAEQQVVDVGSRRAELEWTLNKLINIELKHVWLSSKDTLRRAIRRIGVPNEVRGKVWMILIDQMIGNKYNAKELLEQASKTIELEESCAASGRETGFDEETMAILKQIELDVNRTMPGHKLFDDGAEGGIKLRRILVAYSIHVNRAIAYCQGFNFIVALLLSVFEGDEEKALRGFVCVVDHIFPSKYYFDHYLTGARADQFQLADFICDQLIKSPTLAERKMIEGVTSSITLNWFISLFHGAVPTLTRLTILDHFMLEGVKALFRFTMAILYLALKTTPASSCEVFATIRSTARDMYDIKLLLSIVDQIKLPKDSYFAIRRSFYMVQSSFNSDAFYMQSLSNDVSRSLVPNKPLHVQQGPDTKLPALSFITQSSAFESSGGSGNSSSKAFTIRNSICTDSMQRTRVCSSADKSKVCVQSLGKLGRSHLKLMDANLRTYERALMSPLRNCYVIGISNCGKNLIIGRQSSRRNYKCLREQDLSFHIFEICTEIFDGFYLEDSNQAIILTHQGEVFKIDCAKNGPNSSGGCGGGAQSYSDCIETLMLRDSSSIGEYEKVKLRLATLDTLTNLLWVYVECEDVVNGQMTANRVAKFVARTRRKHSIQDDLDTLQSIGIGPKPKFRSNNPFLPCDNDDTIQTAAAAADWLAVRQNFRRKIVIIDIVSFDIFSAFTVHPSFGEIINLRTSLIAFCQLANPMSNQFSSRIVQIGPTGRYEQLLSFSDVVDYMITIPDSYKQKYARNKQQQCHQTKSAPSDRYSSLRRLLTHSMSIANGDNNSKQEQSSGRSSATFTRYYHSLMRSYSTNIEPEDDAVTKRSRTLPTVGQKKEIQSTSSNQKTTGLIQDDILRSIVASSLGDLNDLSETNYLPVNMAFIFKNGKIALFEFTESYAIHTRESQLDRYDYARVVDVAKNGQDFILTILTVFDKLIKVVI